MSTVNNRSDVVVSSPSIARAGRGEWGFVTLLTLVILVVTAIPFVFAYRIAPPGTRFMGIMLGIEDHLQYFSWMRDLSHQLLAANRLTPEPNSPALHNFLWYVVGHIGVWTGLDYAALFFLLRIVAIVFCMACAYLFFREVLPGVRQRRLALVLFSFGSGLGVIWVVVKYALRLAEAPFPTDIETAEPNTFRLFFAFPHFTIALGLMIAILWFFLLAARTHNQRYALLAGVMALLLSLQHAYDLITIYTTLGVYCLALWARDRRFPWPAVWSSVIIGLFSAPFAAYLLVLVKADPIWNEVLSQFSNVGVYTPLPHHLPILLGVPFLLALAAFRPRMLLSRDAGELLVAAWFIAHFLIVYLPVDFQIHLLLGWQVPITVLAVLALSRYLPAITRRLRARPSVVVGALLALAVVTNVYLMAWRFLDLSRIKAPYYMTESEIAGLNWLRDHTTTNDVVFSNLRFGEFVPMWSDSRAYVAHWANTLDFFTKRETAQQALTSGFSDAERQALLRKYAVTYLVVSPDDTLPPTLDAARLPYLSRVFGQGDVTIYRVQLPPQS